MFEVPFLGRLLSSVSECRPFLDDLIDRIHHRLTVTLLIFCAMLLGAKQQFGQPIQCMLPTHLDRRAWSSYGQYYCFVSSTYRLTYNKTVPNANTRAQLHPDADINYYQWVPIFLAIQALCFCIPGWLWRTLQAQSILDMEAAVKEALILKTTFRSDDREKKLKMLADYITTALKFKMNLRKTKKRRFLMDGINGTSTTFYLTSKFLSTVNDLAQLYFIGRFIGAECFRWSLYGSCSSSSEKRYQQLAVTKSFFPIITFCDMERQTLGSIETNTLQCVLMLNFINEKVFHMLWYWISLLFVLSVVDFVITLIRCVQSGYRENLVKFYLQDGDLIEGGHLFVTDKRYQHIFINEFLGLDGVLLLRFVSDHAGAIVARDMMVALWHCFCESFQDFPYLISPRSIENDKESNIMTEYPLRLLSHTANFNGLVM